MQMFCLRNYLVRVLHQVTRPNCVREFIHLVDLLYRSLIFSEIPFDVLRLCAPRDRLRLRPIVKLCEVCSSVHILEPVRPNPENR